MLMNHDIIAINAMLSHCMATELAAKEIHHINNTFKFAPTEHDVLRLALDIILIRNNHMTLDKQLSVLIEHSTLIKQALAQIE
ncbi:hypothetical protein C9J12_20995 [Photobacterium frigidiphilum]|uniref:Uncharacterized protein n=1 Tax=Photobacterium frigidiphilum TaxID=264736 RepID=A0A2T3JAB3_9GAMM|nr:hypothetical protein [Photobacterium frigidiphilum]PSU45724.1 hypothetical protein C9J12_20995 [Photobacterium frigidiphilum]